MTKQLSIFVLFLLISIQVSAQFSYDLQGHRGSRGIMPENTIPAMIKALDLGSTTLELDLAITKDGFVILSHEPYMNPVICLDPKGNEIPMENKSHNIYQLTYQEILAYDCGSKFHAGFPEQVKFFATKPKLEDLFVVIEKYVHDNGLQQPFYNIEIKSSAEGDGVYHPTVPEFSEKVVQIIEKHVGWDRVNIQSFDFRVLKYLRSTYPQVPLAMLITNAGNYEAYLNELGFQPEIYSPYFTGLTATIVQSLQAKGMKVIPWTVNTTEQMEALLEMGVDGIITDYPNLAPKF
ncbi:glycerophosphodiester phosphodiesterase [Mongoliitalea daihaiensis]|uniref:glycerophosphodiester phosphodiesterase n=1 Tax=Mongoliitalea daihaiensis TaxID=2782006 RepID=UPI001F33E214|nr:glycerophosphodiester phosphodiesterase [Mongoliitalea daihaiensis]UJP66609.1 glycerophosphodiester phosphodiesterase [Mongoliitalea daihaiensis]